MLGALKSHPKMLFLTKLYKGRNQDLETFDRQKVREIHLMNCRLAVQLFGVALRGPEMWFCVHVGPFDPVCTLAPHVAYDCSTELKSDRGPFQLPILHSMIEAAYCPEPTMNSNMLRARANRIPVYR
jgi:hypothetical protein